jgi:glycosyltransferase involved in cell wall biosynthesis
MMTAPRSLDVVYLPLGAAAMGGAERSLLDLAGEMVRRGKRVLILAEEALRSTPFPAIAADRGIDVEWVDWAPEKSRARNFLAAIRVFRRLQVRLIHFNVAWRRGMWTVPLAARLVSRATLLGSMRAMAGPRELVPRRRHFGFVPGMQLWLLPDLLIGRVWAGTLDVTVSINAHDYPERMIAEYGFRPDRLRVIYNGVRLPEQLPSIDDIARLRASLGLDSDDFFVCYSGRVSREKGIHLVVDALANLPAHYKLILVGDGPQTDELAEQAARLGIAGRLVFTGFTEDPYRIMAAADVLVVPSTWYEAFGRVVVEAMSYGVPVIASRTGGMAELFTDHQEGLYVPVGDVQAIERALRFMGEHGEGRKAMGRLGRSLVATKYSLARVAQDYAALYDELTGPLQRETVSHS